MTPPLPVPSPAEEAEEDDDDLPAPGKVWDGPRESLGALMAKQNAVNAAAAVVIEKSNIEAVGTGDFTAQWNATRQLLAQQGPSLSGLLQEGRMVGIQDGLAVIQYSAKQEFCVKQLERNGKKDLVRDALSKVFERPVGVRFEVGSVIAPIAEPSQEASPRPTAPSSPPAMAVAPSAPPADSSTAVRLTEEKRLDLYKSNPLIKAVVDQLGGSVIKFEE